MVTAVGGRFCWRFLINWDYLNLDSDKIIIKGNVFMSEDRLTEALDFKDGRNILAIDTSYYERKLQKFEFVSKAKVRRDFPDSLKIDIEEKKPVGYTIIDGESHVVTEKGDYFPGEADGFLLFKSEDGDALKKLVDLTEKINRIESSFYDRISAVDINYRNEIIIYLKEGFYCKWPVVEDLDEVNIKRSIFLTEKVSEKHISKEGELEYVDLRLVKVGGEEINGAVVVK